MLHLAIECSALAGSVALLNGQSLLVERQLPPEIGSVQSLAPTIAELLSQYGSKSSAQVELISVTHGPGSFTGLRAGLATAKMLGLAWKIPLVAVDTLQVIAVQAAAEIDRLGAEVKGQAIDPSRLTSVKPVVVAVLNAFRKQVFASAWRPSADSAVKEGVDLFSIASSQVVDAAVWQAQPLASLVPCSNPFISAQSGEFAHIEVSGGPASESQTGLELTETEHLWISGPGLRNYLPHEDGKSQLMDSSVWDPTARWVGLLGWQNYQAGRAVSPALLSPNYVRQSAAEEQRDHRVK